MSDLPASIWNMLPPERRGRIATLLGQMALHRMRDATVAPEAPNDGPCPTSQRLGLRQDSAAPPRPAGDCLCPPIHGSTGCASSGVDQAATRARGSRGAIWLDAGA